MQFIDGIAIHSKILKSVFMDFSILRLSNDKKVLKGEKNVIAI